jgi:hypothetical protein
MADVVAFGLFHQEPHGSPLKCGVAVAVVQVHVVASKAGPEARAAMPLKQYAVRH